MKQNYLKIPGWFFLLAFLLITSGSFAQGDKLIRGKVVSLDNNMPLPGVNIIEKGLSNGTMTDIDGNFSIEVSGPDAVLVFTFVGFKPYEVRVGDQKNLNVQLETNEEALSEVVVVGYKSVLKKDVAGAVSSIDTESLQDIPSASLLTKLAGKAPGVNAVVRTGVPGGSGGGLVIRGNTNLSGASDVTGLSNPLYIVDGIPMSLQDFAGFDVTQNDFFATLNPNELESIDVLKDAAATAIYGSRGANGVVIIKTKRGKAGQTRFNVRASTGVNFQPEKLKVFIGEAERQEKIRLYKESLATLFRENPWIDVRNGLEVEGYMYPPVLTDKYNPAFNNAYDYQDLFYQTGFNQQYDLSMDGGTEKNTFRAGLGYYDEEGILAGFGFQRATMNVSLNTKVKSNIQNDLSVRLTYLNRKGGSNDILRSFPTSPTQLPSSLYYKTPDELNLLSGRLGDIHNLNKSYMVSVNESLRIDLAKGLTLDNQAGVMANIGKKEFFVPSTAATNNLSYVEVSSSGNYTLNLHSVLSYFKQFGNHEVAGLAGIEANMDQQTMSLVSGEAGPSDYIKVLQGYSKENINGFSDNVKTNLLSYFGTLSYGYKDRYHIEGVVRRDGSSRFGENNKWATFPSVKAYWVFSEEPFINGDDILSFGKVRISYGSSGSIAADPLLQYNSLIASSNIGGGINNLYSNKIDVKTYGGEGALLADFNRIANKSLSWSKSNEIDFGLDLQFFNNRLYITGDIYSRLSTDLVYVSQLSPHMGYNSINSNLVDMISNGWELGITGYFLPRDGDFQWDASLNFARNKTVIDKLGNGGRDYINGNYAFVEGRPAFQYYTYEYLGVLQDMDDLPVNPNTGMPIKYLWADAGLALNQQGSIFPGMPLFADANGDYLIDGGNYGYDKKIIEDKSPEPDLFGGFQTNFKYKNLSLGVQTSFAMGHYIMNTSLQQMLSQYDDNIRFFTDALYDLSDSVDFWEQPGDDAYYPMRYITYADGGSSRSFRESSMFLEKGDYFSIDAITLSYNMPQKWMDQIGLGRVNLYTTLQNAYMWKESNVPDPRMVSKNGYYNGQGYPITRNLSFGINAQL